MGYPRGAKGVKGAPKYKPGDRVYDGQRWSTVTGSRPSVFSNVYTVETDDGLKLEMPEGRLRRSLAKAFNVGDRVRVLHGRFNGRYGTVMAITPGGKYDVSLDDGTPEEFFETDLIREKNFDIGDPVQIANGFHRGARGRIYSMLEEALSAEPKYRVRLDNGDYVEAEGSDVVSVGEPRKSVPTSATAALLGFTHMATKAKAKPLKQGEVWAAFHAAGLSAMGLSAYPERDTPGMVLIRGFDAWAPHYRDKVRHALQSAGFEVWDYGPHGLGVARKGEA